MKPLLPDIIDVDGKIDTKGVVFMGKAARQPDGLYHCLANVYGALCKVEVSVRPQCSECGGTIQLAPGEGRTREFRRGVVISIPDDFAIPTCAQCGETYMIPEVSEPLDGFLSYSLEFPT